MTTESHDLGLMSHPKDGLIDGCGGAWVDGWAEISWLLDGWMDGWMGGWMDGWGDDGWMDLMSRFMDEWVDERMDG